MAGYKKTAAGSKKAYQRVAGMKNAPAFVKKAAQVKKAATKRKGK